MATPRLSAADKADLLKRLNRHNKAEASREAAFKAATERYLRGELALSQEVPTAAQIKAMVREITITATDQLAKYLRARLKERAESKTPRKPALDTRS